MCSASAGSGVGAAAFTFGTSLIGTIYSLRQISVLVQQKKLIEDELRRRCAPDPRNRKRDIAAGTAIGLVSAGLGFAIPFGIDHGLGEAAAAASGPAVHATTAAASHALLYAQHIG